jgi:hypothetical protein
MSHATGSTGTSANIPNVTPIFEKDTDGNIVMGEAPDWDNMTNEQMRNFLQEMFQLNSLLVDAVNGNNKKPTKKDMGVLIKRQPPPMYGGKTSELRSFQTQLRAYFMDFEDTIDTDQKKVSFAASRLEGTALKWFRPVWDVYLDNPKGPLPEQVKEIFDSFEKFEKELSKAFGDVGEIRMAENKLSEICQKGKCSDYAVKFRDLASRVEWGQPALIKRFYDGLYRSVKEKVYDIDRTKHNLISFIEECVKADNLLYELNMGNRAFSKDQPNQGKRRQEPVAKDNSGTPGKMDIDMMQKRKDFKCYNCGKPNHLARNCKSPKKERIPEPKTAHTMEKETRTLHVMERPTSPKEYEEFYVSDDYLSEDSETVDNTSTSEIPDRRTIPQVDFRRLVGISAETLEPEEESDQGNYGLTYWSHGSDIYKTHEDETPEIKELNKFHQRCVEIDESIEGYTPLKLYDWLNTQQPFNAFQRIIRAVPTNVALIQDQSYYHHPKDHASVNPAHPQHDEICWTNCITHRCMYHIQDKIKHHIFPVRIPFLPVTEVIPWNKHFGWTPTYRYRSLKVVILEPFASSPLECRQNGRTEDCKDYWCERHQFSKIMTWHDERDARHDCGKNDFQECTQARCHRHKDDKLENWHMTKNCDSLL